jgi:hypothetical protein
VGEGITGNDRSVRDVRSLLLSAVRCPLTMSGSRKFVSLGMFIIDEFAFADASGTPTGRSLSPQEGLYSSLVHTRSSGLFVDFL